MNLKQSQPRRKPTPRSMRRKIDAAILPLKGNRYMVDYRSIANISIHPFVDTLPSSSAERIESIVNDLQVFGQRYPLFIANGVLIDGKSRLQAFSRLAEHKDSIVVDVVDLGPLDEAMVHSLVGYFAVNAKPMTTRQRANLATRVRLFHKQQRMRLEPIAQMAPRYGISRRTLEYYWQKAGGSRKYYRRSSNQGLASSKSIASDLELARTMLAKVDVDSDPGRFKQVSILAKRIIRALRPKHSVPELQEGSSIM